MKKLLLLTVGYILLLPIFLFADPIFRINSSGDHIVDKHGVCKILRVTSGNDVMVPTGTSGEWSAFLDHPLASITIQECTPCPAGVQIGDTCTGGTIYAGQFDPGGGSKNYLITPGGCNDSATPTCGVIGDYLQKNWGAQGITLSTNSIDGKVNVATLLGLGVSVPAAEYCDNLVYGGFSDWYLGSVEEMAFIISNHAAIGGFHGGWYNTSSDANSCQWCVKDDHYMGRDVFSQSSNHYARDGWGGDGAYIRCIRRY